MTGGGLAVRYARALGERAELLTPRLHLRRPGEADIPAIVAVAGDREVSFRVSRIPHPYRKADARFFLGRIVPCNLVWGIFARGDPALIGMIGLHPVDADPDVLELGYYLAPSRWGEGLATEAGAVVVAYGLALAGPGGVVAGHYADNPASGRVLAKLGFVETGRGERHCLASGETHVSIEMRR